MRWGAQQCWNSPGADVLARRAAGAHSTGASVLVTGCRSSERLAQAWEGSGMKEGVQSKTGRGAALVGGSAGKVWDVLKRGCRRGL